MKKLIYLEDAIDALKEHRALYCDNTPDTFSKLSYVEKSRVDELDTAIATLVNLPSAEPEIIRCKNCKHHHYDSKDIPYCDRIDYGYGWKDDDFCSRAERKENR